MDKFKIGDKVKCVTPGYPFNDKIGTIVKFDISLGYLYEVQLDRMKLELYEHQLALVESEKCECSKTGWIQDDRFYYLTPHNTGFTFEPINHVKFCPLCGKELPKE